MKTQKNVAIILLEQFGQDAEMFLKSLEGFQIPHTTVRTQRGRAVVVPEVLTLTACEATAFDFDYIKMEDAVFQAAVAASVGATNT